MLAYQYHRVLQRIAKETFPEQKILSFKIEIYPKEMKSRHGDYHSGKRVIRIFNLSQKVEYTIGTALHELAHHCEFSIYGSTGHSKRFYQVFKPLLETAVSMGVVDYEILRTQENANDISMLEKHTGPVDIYPKSLTQQEEVVIKVLQSFSFREKLKEKKYFYDDIEKAWGKILLKEKLEVEKEFLFTLTTANNIVIRPLFDLTFEAIYYVFISGGFEKREELKLHGYFFKELDKKKGWAKKIVSTNLENEKRFLQTLSISNYKVSSSLK